MSKSSALYRILADTLRAAIVSGHYVQGDQLPTELELCTTHSVSRHTARDALRLLSDEGLIKRTRGVGTIVTSASPMGRFSQDWGEIGDILQYARDTHLVISDYGPATAQHLQTAKVSTSDAWMMVEGVRRRLEGGPILALTTICVRGDLMPARKTLDVWPLAIGEYIAAHNHVQAVRIEQEIAAILLSRDQAKRLGEHAGDPALATLRRYFNADEHVFLTSLSVHPADRFVYTMSATR